MHIFSMKRTEKAQMWALVCCLLHLQAFTALFPTIFGGVWLLMDVLSLHIENAFQQEKVSKRKRVGRAHAMIVFVVRMVRLTAHLNGLTHNNAPSGFGGHPRPPNTPAEVSARCFVEW